MQRAEAFDTVRRLAGELLDADPARITDGTCFVDDLSVDSLALIEYAMALEDALGVRLPEDELTQVQTVGELVALLATKEPAA